MHTQTHAEACERHQSSLYRTVSSARSQLILVQDERRSQGKTVDKIVGAREGEGHELQGARVPSEARCKRQGSRKQSETRVERQKIPGKR
jgi:hypothetical protein